MITIKIKSVVVLFENTEFIEIPVELIGEIFLKDYERILRRFAINEIDTKEAYNFIYLSINRKYKELVELKSMFGDALNEDISASDRVINFNDISHIEIIYKDISKENDLFSVPWISSKDDDFINEAQVVRENAAGDLEILISTYENIESKGDLVSSLKKEFDDLDKMNYKWDMYK